MARRPDFRKREEIMDRQQLNALSDNLAHLSMSAVREFYQRAYRECAIINGATFAPARAIQELVRAWKRLRKLRR